MSGHDDRPLAPVITGLGIVAPTGLTVTDHWEAVLAGKSGIGPISRFDAARYPVRLAGQIPGFVARELVPSRLIAQTDLGTHLALFAAEQALADSAVDPAVLPEYEMAVVTAASSGGTEFGQHEMENLYQHAPSWVSAYQSIAWFYAANTGQLSIRHGMRGPCGVLCCEQAGGLDAIGHARRMLRRGARLVLTGGTDASLCPYGLTAQLSTGLLSTVSEPDRAYLPFDTDASGYLPGEGGAIIVLEDARAAATRGAAPGYARVLGYAAGFDPAPDAVVPEHRRRAGRAEGSTDQVRPPALRRTAEAALKDAGIGPDQVDVVFADALGVPAEDAAEATAIRAIFGPHGVPVTAPKTLTGRLYAGGAALDVATAALSLQQGAIPHTAQVTSPIPDLGIDLVLGSPRETAPRTALVLARGHGGFNAALVLGRIED